MMEWRCSRRRLVQLAPLQLNLVSLCVRLKLNSHSRGQLCHEEFCG